MNEKSINSCAVCCLLLGIYCLLLAANCFAWGAGASAGMGLEFEQMGNARSAAMGEAGAAIEGAVDFIHYNPAALSGLDRFEISFAYMLGFGDLSFCNLIYNFPTEIGPFAVSLSYFDAGSAELNFEDGSMKIIKAQADLVFTVSYSREFFKNIPLGLSAKIISSSLAEYPATQAFAIDAAGIYRTPVQGLRVGFCLKNLGGGLKYLSVSEPLPATIRIGASYEIFEQGLLVSFDLKWLLNEGKFVSGIGAEYNFTENLLFRAGYVFTDAEGLTLGMGFRQKQYTFDYAFTFVKDIAPFGNQRLGFRMQL